MKLIVPSESPDCAASSDIRMTQLSTTGGNTMNDKGLNLSPKQRAALEVGFKHLIAERGEAEAKALSEVREAFRSILGSLLFCAGRMRGFDGMGADELQVLAQEVDKILGYIKKQLSGVSDERLD